MGSSGFGQYILYMILPMALGFWAQHAVKSTFRRYSEVEPSNGLTGAQVARRILDANGLSGVPIEAVPGEMTDHYDPSSRTVRLSQPVCNARSISAISVAAHEVGHAIQHAKAYAPMTVRSAMFPAVAFSSQVWMILLFAGFFLHATGLIWLAIALYSVAVLFHVVTLPVEFDASRRAKKQLQELGLVAQGESQAVASVLRSAAMTYVAGALASIAMLAYFLGMARD